MRRSVNAGLKCVARAAAEALCEVPTGAAAGQRETQFRVGRVTIIHAGGKTVVAGGDIVRTGGGIAVGLAAAAERRSPGTPALIGRRSRRCLGEHRRIGLSDIRRENGLLLRREAGHTVAAA